MIRSALPLIATLVLLVGAMPLAANAQTGAQSDPVLTTEGISGDSDKKRRGPILSVGVHRNQVDGSATRGRTANTTLLVDAVVPNGEYAKYPIRFDFYVNRKLVSSQLRSTELPGPIGLEVTPDMGTIPFNYSVVATLLSPNREFTTILNGAVTSAAPSPIPETGKLSSCTLEIVPQADAELTVYIANTVTVTSAANGSFTVSFETSTLDDGSQGSPVTANATITVTDGAASGTLTTSVAGNNQTVNLSGSASVENNELASLEVTPDVGATALSCS